MHKVRIIALYIQYRDGVPDEDRRRLYQHARLTLAEQDAVNALVHFGVRITRVGICNFNKISIINFQKGPTDKDVKKKIKQKPSAGEEYELSRFKPALKTVLEVYFAPSRSVDSLINSPPGSSWGQTGDHNISICKGRTLSHSVVTSFTSTANNILA